MTLTHRGRYLFKGEDDEDIPSSSTLSPIEDVAVQDKPNEVRIGPMTRSITKLLEQQVNSLLIEYNVCDYENFILPKSMHLCMIRFEEETSMARGGEEKNVKIVHGCAREEREEGAGEGDHQAGEV